MDERYLTSTEAREYLRIGKNTLLKFRRLGLPFVKVSRKVVYRKSDIDAFMESHLVTPKKKGRKEGRP
jgi:excisionase family DNA binding protein